MYELVTDDRKLFVLEDDWQPMVMCEHLDWERAQNVNCENTRRALWVMFVEKGIFDEKNYLS